MKKIINFKYKRGFTLLELLLVVAAIAILATIVFAVLSPADTLNKFRDTNRLSNIQAIESAMALYAIDNGGDVPNKSDWSTSTPLTICGNTDHNASCDLDLTDLTNNSKYMIEVPSDPSVSVGSNSSGYEAIIDSNGLVVISAPLASTGTIEAKGKFNPL
ncbi:prepilin-type N-terminal cleavage/methylation domain-containing protein [Candidatus Nomurabacteria bacterium]|nr:prepilin-type N-terminal cleavage/methylation domain-containing protein [Candidatus Nomurabacteria bacterium]